MTDTLGRLDAIWRFPIKSFQGESIERTTLTKSGIHADRVLALRHVESGKIVSGKHARLGERVLAFDARFEKEPEAGAPLPRILARIDRHELSSDDPAALASACSDALGEAVEVVAAGSGAATYDSYWPDVEDLPLAGASIDLDLPLAASGSFADLEPLHLLTTASVSALASRAPEPRIETARFRPSLLIDSGDAEGFVEHAWSGRRATLGGAVLELTDAAPRCIMTTRAQAGLPRDVAVLKALVRENRREFMGMMMPSLGIYAKVVSPGEIAVGDVLVAN